MPLGTPTVLLGFLLPWTWGISSGLLQQSTAIAPYLGRVASPDFEREVAISALLRPRSHVEVGLLLPPAALDFRRGVAALVCHPLGRIALLPL